jgi:FtsZ-binding cell division protein ZapB
MMMIEDFKEDINNSLKELQENTGKQLEALKRKHKNPLKNFRKKYPNR